MSVTETKAAYVKAMTHLKDVVRTRQFCCRIHATVIADIVDVFNAKKNEALKAFNGGQMPEAEFIKFIDRGTALVEKFAEHVLHEWPNMKDAEHFNVVHPNCPGGEA